MQGVEIEILYLKHILVIDEINVSNLLISFYLSPGISIYFRENVPFCGRFL